MKDFLKHDICIEEARIVPDEPFSLEEYAALAQLLGKFATRNCETIGQKLKVSAVLAMVTEAATREVKN